MRLEVLNTGSELLLGTTLNTHGQWFGQELFKLGLRVQLASGLGYPVVDIRLILPAGLNSIDHTHHSISTFRRNRRSDLVQRRSRLASQFGVFRQIKFAQNGNSTSDRFQSTTVDGLL